jgi:hypothetical protein
VSANVTAPIGPRAFHATAYDPKRRKAVLFGGSPGVHDRFLNQTWEYGLPPLQLIGLERQPDSSLEIRWSGEAPPYQLQSRASLTTGNWQNEGPPTQALSTTVQTGAAAKFFRVLSRFGNAP